jgi:hypothetical protein
VLSVSVACVQRTTHRDASGTSRGCSSAAWSSVSAANGKNGSDKRAGYDKRRVTALRALVAAGMGNSYHGHAVREVAADWREAWEGMDLSPQEIVDAGNPVVVLGRFHPRARGSGIEFETPVGQVLWVERGLVVRDRVFNTWDEALRVAGIPTPAFGPHPATSM